MHPQLALHLARAHQADLHGTGAQRRRARPPARQPATRAAWDATAGYLTLALGTAASAGAPNLAVLATAQAAVGAAAGLLIAGALAALAAWTEPRGRARARAIASLGQPMAWVAGMPLGGHPLAPVGDAARRRQAGVSTDC
jgi:MFS family permease